VLAHLEDPVVLVTAFVEGPTMEAPELREPRAVVEVAAALRKIHGCGEIGATFDAFRLVEDYAAATRARDGEVPPAYEVAHAAAARIEAVPALDGGIPVLCHDDLLPANFIDTPDGIRIVDWEYAGMGNPWFDLGNFAVNNELGAAEEEAFLSAYLGTPPTPADLAALRLMRLMSDFREAMWGVVQQAISDLDFDFEDYATKHFDRLQAAIAAPEFEARLEDANAAR
jgi:thiamine kinase-like enzyme